jgi:hypothetical protein
VDNISRSASLQMRYIPYNFPKVSTNPHFVVELLNREDLGSPQLQGSTIGDVNGSTVEDVEGSDRDGDHGTNEGDPRDIGVHDPPRLASAELFGVVGTAGKDLDGVRAILTRMECSFQDCCLEAELWEVCEVIAYGTCAELHNFPADTSGGAVQSGTSMPSLPLSPP